MTHLLGRISFVVGLWGLMGCGGSDVTGPEVKVTVMTRNLFLGSDLAEAALATSKAEVPAKAATLWRTIVQSDFPARAELLADEIAQAFRNVERTLATAGAGWEHVIHVNSYHVGGFPSEVNEAMVKLYRHYMPDRAPIWTQVGVAALGLPTMRIEIRVTAIVPS